MPDRFGSPNGSYSFGGSSDYILTEDAAPFGSGSRSVSFWFSTISRSEMAAFDYGGTGQGENFQIAFNVACPGVGIDVSNGVETRGDSTVSDSRWHHCVLVYDSLQGTTIINIKVYIDDVLQPQHCWAVDQNAPVHTINASPFMFGKSVTNTRFFNGSLDDIAVYTRALTAREVDQIYKGSQQTQNCLPLQNSLLNGLVSYYPFCGNANDESGNGNNGTVSGATLSTDRFGNPNAAYSFNGVNSYIFTLRGGPASALSRTVSLWMKTDTRDLSVAFDYGASGASYQLILNSNCKGIGIDVGSGTVSKGDSNVLDNNWHHVVYVYDSLAGTTISDIKLYIDGVLHPNVLCYAINPAAQVNTGRTEPFNIGRAISNTRYYKGKLDDIIIWDRPLNQEEINSLYFQDVCQQSLTVTDTLRINYLISGFNPITYQNTIRVYPNPTGNQVIIDNGNLSTLSGHTIKITNSIGQQVFMSTIDQQQFSIDMSTFGSAGLYHILLINPDGVIVADKKLVLQ